nr:hypothetical protein [Tanacetum cinerariifolium]
MSLRRVVWNSIFKTYDELSDKAKLQADCDLRLPTLFFKVFHQMSMLSLIITKFPKIYEIKLSCLCKARHYQSKNVSCTQSKRRRDAAWFKEKVLLVQAHAEGKEFDEEQLTFLTDPGVADGQVS